jgi:hypothetical protein
MRCLVKMNCCQPELSHGFCFSRASEEVPLALPREVDQLGLASLLWGCGLDTKVHCKGGGNFSLTTGIIYIIFCNPTFFLPTIHFIHFCLVSHHTNFSFTSCLSRGTWWRHSWLRQCATSQMVAGSIPDGVIGIFHWHNPFSCTMALRSTQPLTEMSTMNISWRVMATSVWESQPYHLHVSNVLKCWSLNLLEPSGPGMAHTGIVLLHFFTSYYMY